MNITALRPRFNDYLEPLAAIAADLGITPNQLSLFSLISGGAAALLYSLRFFFAGTILLLLSGVFDLVDGSVARRTDNKTNFGAVFDWIVDKYVDGLVLLGVGLSGIQIISWVGFIALPPLADFGVIAIAIIGSLMNTFIKPVVYAEVGFSERKDGKIDDPLEGVGFFGRPETILVLAIGGLTGFIWVSILVIAVCTNLSAVQRVLYLYRELA